MSTRAGTFAAGLRRRLADEIEASGDLRSRPWRRAVEQVPRQMFLGGRIYQRLDEPGATLWKPYTPADLGQPRWLELAHENTTWVTQFDGSDQTPDGTVQGAPTSSSTLPGLVVRMLEDLDVHDGHTVLEIGTGTGYSTALLCQRLGGDLVTSIEVDPDVADRAAVGLGPAGSVPALITGDGLAGHRARAPYDRIIATCSVRAIPEQWIAQARPGGRILTTLSGWLQGSGLVALDVTGGGHAHGRFLPGTVSFMPARTHAAPPLTRFPPQQGSRRTARFGPQIMADWMGRFLAQLTLPGVQHARLSSGPGTPAADLLIDQRNGAYAWLTQDPGGTWTAWQDGPTRLWDQIEHTWAIYQDAGRPPQQQFTLTITPHAQTVHLHAGNNQHSWTLPHD
jgi:methyltransferase of ATP-grasp peptide maturase system